MLIRKSWIVAWAAVLTSGVFAQSRPDAPEVDVKEHYTKYEYRIPMRDGVQLFTSVYVPKDAAQRNRNTSFLKPDLGGGYLQSRIDSL